MNRFKRVFRLKSKTTAPHCPFSTETSSFLEAPSVDIENIVRVSQSTSSIDIESVSLEATTDSEEWDTEDEHRGRGTRDTLHRLLPEEPSKEAANPNPFDVEPNWSNLPVTSFSREVYETEAPSRVEVVSVVDFRRNTQLQPYKNLVIAVVAELHQVLNLQLPRYMVALLSNYRFMNNDLGNRTETDDDHIGWSFAQKTVQFHNDAMVEQFDLYLSQVQEFLYGVKNTGRHSYQDITARTGRTISVLGSILEVVGRNASQDVFYLSFQENMISAFNQKHIDELDINPRYIEYLRHRPKSPSRSRMSISASSFVQLLCDHVSVDGFLKQDQFGADRSHDERSSFMLANARNQTDERDFPLTTQGLVADVSVQTEPAEPNSPIHSALPDERSQERNRRFREISVSPSSASSFRTTVAVDTDRVQLQEAKEAATKAEAAARKEVAALSNRSTDLEKLMETQSLQYIKELNDKQQILLASQRRLTALENTISALENRHHSPDTETQQSFAKSDNHFFVIANQILNAKTEEILKSCKLFSDTLESRTGGINRKLTVLRENGLNLIYEEISSHKSDFKRLLQELMHRDGELAESITEIEELRASNKKKDDELRVAQKDVDLLEQRIASFSTDSFAKERRFRAITNENERLKEIILRKAERSTEQSGVEPERQNSSPPPHGISACSDDLRLAQNENENLRRQCKELSENLSDKTQESEKVHLQNVDLLRRFGQLEKQLSNSEENCTNLSSDSKKKEQLFRKLQAALAAAIADGNDLQSDVQELKNQRKIQKETLEKLDSQKREIIAELAEREEALAVARERIRAQEDEMSNRSRTVLQNEQSIQRYQEQMAVMEENMNQLKQQVTLVERGRNFLSDEVQNIARTSELRQQNLNHKEKEAKLLEQNLMQVQQQVTFLEQNRALLTEELHTALRSLETKEKNVVHYEHQISSFEDTIVELQQELARSQCERAQIVDDLKQKTVDHEDRVKRQKENLEAEMNALRSALGESEQKLVEQEAESNICAGQLQNEVSQLRLNLNQLKNDLQQKDGEIHDFRIKLDVYKAKTEARRASLVHRNRRPDHGDGSIKPSKDGKSHKDQLIEAKRRIKNLEAELEQLRSQIVLLNSTKEVNDVPLIDMAEKACENQEKTAEKQLTEAKQVIETLKEKLEKEHMQKTPVAAPAETAVPVVESSESTETFFHKNQFVEIRKKIKVLETELTEKQNIIRAMEYGKETLTLKVSGLLNQNQQCDNVIMDLKSQLASVNTHFTQELEMTSKNSETRLSEALMRIAQKGEQLEFARRNVDNLLKREEDLMAEISRLTTLKNLAEAKAEKITDETSRDIDELELQIKSLREQETRIRAAVVGIEVSTLTDDTGESTATSQTSLSFQYGYDFESGCRIRKNIFSEQCSSKEVQSHWPHDPRDATVQANPLAYSVSVQTLCHSRAVPAQTDVVMTEPKYCQTDVSERRSSSTQTIFTSTKYQWKTEIPPVLPVSTVALLNMATSTTDVPEVPVTNRFVDEVLEEFEPSELHGITTMDSNPSFEKLKSSKESFPATETTSSASTLAGRKSIQSELNEVASNPSSGSSGVSGQLSMHRFGNVRKNTRRVPSPNANLPSQIKSEAAAAANEFTSLHNVCRYLYDTLVKNTATYEALVEVSNNMDYSLSQEDFDYHTGQKFLGLLNTSTAVRNTLLTEWEDGFYPFLESFKELVEHERNRFGSKIAPKTLRADLEESQSWAYEKRFERQVDEKAAKKLDEFFEWFATRKTRKKGVKVTVCTFRINGQRPTLKHGQLALEQFQYLQHFNDYVVVCFLRITHASRNLAKTFGREIRTLHRLSYGRCDVKFASLAMAFAKESNKMRQILHHEIHGTADEFYHAYENARLQKVQEMKGESGLTSTLLKQIDGVPSAERRTKN